MWTFVEASSVSPSVVLVDRPAGLHGERQQKQGCGELDTVPADVVHA